MISFNFSSSFKLKRFLVIFFVISFTSIMIFSSEKRNYLLLGVAYPFVEVSGYLQKTMLHFVGGISDTFYKYSHVAENYEELIKVRAESQKHESLRIELAEERHKTSKLAQLLSYKQEHLLQNSKAAQVVGRSSTNNNHVLRINRGDIDGVVKGSPVLSSEGVIGQVTMVARNFSDVLMINSAVSSTESIAQGTRVKGIIKGANLGSDGLLYFNVFDQLQKINSGDIVVTSGINSAFPKGIPVGKIVSTKLSEEKNALVSSVQPFANFKLVEYVLVLTEKRELRE